MVRKRCVFIDWGAPPGGCGRWSVASGCGSRRTRLCTRCTVWNGEIAALLKPEVRGKVPLYVFETQDGFGDRERCDKIYWRGTRLGHNVLKALEAAEDRMESKMLEAIANRRSVRFYKKDIVSDEDIALVLKAGFSCLCCRCMAGGPVARLGGQGPGQQGRACGDSLLSD